jgi:hypothetical protein
MTQKPKLTEQDFKTAAKKLGCETAVIKAVVSVESKGDGFYQDGFPTILFERHKFWKHAPAGRREEWLEKYPSICNPAATPKGGYGTTDDQRKKFNQAFLLNKTAAMKACSWGTFQELGENYADLGFKTVGEFVDQMKKSQRAHLEIFVRSIIARGLRDELQKKDWRAFAKNYNGPAYEKFNYHGQLATAYKRHSNAA